MNGKWQIQQWLRLFNFLNMVSLLRMITKQEKALTQYEVIDGVLYHIEPDKTLRIVLPSADRKKVFNEAHSGVFGAHLREAKIHGQLAKHYWWP